jgi:photosystem II stability/assembly factor-like uncharacterized protein
MLMKIFMSKRVFDMKILFALTGLLVAFSAHADSMPGTASNMVIVKKSDEQQSASGMAEVGGRVLVLFTHPILPQKLWAGTEHGGLWQSTDSGNSWAPASVLMRKLTVSSLAVDPGNPDIMYAGTGEGRSNDVALRGAGMFKSGDGGLNWELLPLTAPVTVGQSWSHINHIAISSAGIILAATSDNNHNGFIFRSTDGGQTWGLTPVYTGSRVGPRNMIYNVRFNPDNPNTAIFMDAYANVTHSSDGGATWKVVKKSSTCS